MNYGSELERLLVAGVEAGRSDEVLNLLIAEVSGLLIDGYNSFGRLTLPCYWRGLSQAGQMKCSALKRLVLY